MGYTRLSVFLGLGLLAACSRGPGTYYIAASGNDAAEGSQAHPWKSLSHRFVSGTVLLHGGDTLRGTLRLDSCHDLTVSSYGDGRAVIFSGDSAGLVVYAGTHVSLERLCLIGAGRKTGNVREGLSVVDSRSVFVG